MKKSRITAYTSYDDPRAMLTVCEVAIWINRNYKALLLSINHGKASFSACRIGGQWRVRKEQLQEKKATQHFKR
jgi:hypothetical protein